MVSEGTVIEPAKGPRFRVAAVDPEHRVRTKLAIELASFGAVPFESIDEVVEKFEEHHAVVAVVGPGFANDTGFAQIQRLARQRPEIGVVVLVDELSLPVLQQALRSGVRDVVPVGADESQLRQAIDRVGEVVLAGTSHAAGAGPAASQTKLGKVVVAFSTKGGVGKSTIATNVAASLAMRGRSTAIVDADLQFGDVAVLLGIPPQHTTIDAAGAIQHADVELMEGLLATHAGSNLRVLPGPIEPSAADGITPEAMVGIAQLLRTMFEFVIIDMPPHFDDVVLALLEEADEVLLVASMDIPSIKNLKVGMQTLDLLSLAGGKLRLVLNRANAKVNLEIGDVERALGIPAQFRVPSDISVPQSVNRGAPVVMERPKSQAALALTLIADSYAGIEHVADETATGESPRRRWRRD